MSQTATACMQAVCRKESPSCPESPRILVVLPRGEAIRNFVFTGSLEHLSRQAQVMALSVNDSEQIWNCPVPRPYRLQPLRKQRETYVVNFFREMLDMAHGRYLWSKAAQERWRLRNCECTKPGPKLKRLCKKLLTYPFAAPSSLAALSQAERTVSRLFRSTNDYLKLLSDEKPDLVFNASHVHARIAIPVVEAAQWLGIPTAAFIFSWDNLTSQGRIIPSYDHYLVWNEDARRQLLAIYPDVAEERVHVTGTPQFDLHFRPEYWWSREEFCRRVGADPRRPIVLYTTGMANHMPAEDRIVERLADVLGKMTEFGLPQLMVRIYPKDRSGRFGELMRRRPDILFPEIPWEPAWLTPKFEDAYLLVNMLRHASVGVNVASTISLELCMFDKPVVNVGFDPPGVDIRPISFSRYYRFDHYRPVVASGAVEVAGSPADLETMLRSALKDPERLSGQRQTLIRSMFDGTLDGNTGTRVAGLLAQIAAQRA